MTGTQKGCGRIAFYFAKETGILFPETCQRLQKLVLENEWCIITQCESFKANKRDEMVTEARPHL